MLVLHGPFHQRSVEPLFAEEARGIGLLDEVKNFFAAGADPGFEVRPLELGLVFFQDSRWHNLQTKNPSFYEGTQVLTKGPSSLKESAPQVLIAQMKRGSMFLPSMG